MGFRVQLLLLYSQTPTLAGCTDPACSRQALQIVMTLQSQHIHSVCCFVHYHTQTCTERHRRRHVCMAQVSAAQGVPGALLPLLQQALVAARCSLLT
jgi:hypothetical protein